MDVFNHLTIIYQAIILLFIQLSIQPLNLESIHLFFISCSYVSFHSTTHSALPHSCTPFLSIHSVIPLQLILHSLNYPSFHPFMKPLKSNVQYAYAVNYSTVIPSFWRNSEIKVIRCNLSGTNPHNISGSDISCLLCACAWQITRN